MISRQEGLLLRRGLSRWQATLQVAGIGLIAAVVAVTLLHTQYVPVLVFAVASATLATLFPRRVELPLLAVVVSVSYVNPLLAAFLMSASLLTRGFRSRVLTHPGYIVGIATGIYLVVGGANISSYRGDVNDGTVRLILLHGVVFLLATFWSGGSKRLVAAGPAATPAATSSMLLVSAPAVAGLLLLTQHVGLVLLNPSLRFRASAISLTLLETAIAAVAFYCYRSFGSRRPNVSDSFTLVPLFLLLGASGYRGWLVMALAIVAFHLLYFRRVRLTLAKVLVLALVIAAVTGGFDNLRRMNNPEALSAAAAADEYGAEDIPPGLRQIHFALRESIALTQRLLSLDSHRKPKESLLLADLKTVLPGQQPSGGSIIGDLLGRQQEGGLTPGAVGASIVDLRHFSYGFFGILGLLAGLLWRQTQRAPYWSTIYFLFVMYFLHFLHRGIPKLSYLLVPVYFYLAVRLVGSATGPTHEPVRATTLALSATDKPRLNIR
jgi:hypothetical protein